MCSIILFLFENPAVHEIMWKNVVERGRPQMTIQYGAFWIPKATNTYSECVILIFFHCNNGGTNASQCYINCKSIDCLDFLRHGKLAHFIFASAGHPTISFLFLNTLYNALCFRMCYVYKKLQVFECTF